MHAITTDIDRRIIEVTLEGMCSMQEFVEFVGELRATITQFPIGPKPPATLYNFTEALIQTQEVVNAMKALAENPAMVHRTVAMYTEGALARRQAQRIAENRTNMRIFTNRQAALDWIAEEQAR
jgi:hypothetical protein